MTYDPDHKRCDLSKNIECKDGERPTWTPPDGCKSFLPVDFSAHEHSGGQSDRLTTFAVTKTTAGAPESEAEVEEEEEKKTRSPKRRKLTTRPAPMVTKLAASRVTAPISELVENSACTFQGNMPDPDNCQCNDRYQHTPRNLSSFLVLPAYYTCTDDAITRVHCPDKHLFDDDNRICNDYRKIFCGQRPTNERGNDPCETLRALGHCISNVRLQVSVKPMDGTRTARVNAVRTICAPNSARRRWANVHWARNGTPYGFAVTIRGTSPRLVNARLSSRTLPLVSIVCSRWTSQQPGRVLVSGSLFTVRFVSLLVVLCQNIESNLLPMGSTRRRREEKHSITGANAERVVCFSGRITPLSSAISHE